MMTYAHVIYKKTGVERKTTIKAYNLLKNQYTLLGYVDENGNPVDGPQQQVQTQKKRNQDAAPAVSKKMSPEEIEVKKAELRALNEGAIQKAKDEQAKREAEKKAQVGDSAFDPEVFVTEPLVKERKKPGPKPKTHA
jgi:hypothetical protein